MNHLTRFCLFTLLVTFGSAYKISLKHSLVLTTGFEEQIKNSDIFVLFIEDPESHQKFLDLWDEVAEVAEAEQTSENLKFGIVDCHENKKLCLKQKIQTKIELKFFGKNKNKWPELTKFLETTVQDVIREDELIKRLDRAGNVFIFYKVVYCPYCKDAMDEWINVYGHFKNYNNVFVASIDCTRHKQICRKYGVRKYPRFQFIHIDKNGKKTIDNYKGHRKSEDMIEYCEKMIS